LVDVFVFDVLGTSGRQACQRFVIALVLVLCGVVILKCNHILPDYSTSIAQQRCAMLETFDRSLSTVNSFVDVAADGTDHATQPCPTVCDSATSQTIDKLEEKVAEAEIALTAGALQKKRTSDKDHAVLHQPLVAPEICDTEHVGTAHRGKDEGLYSLAGARVARNCSDPREYKHSPCSDVGAGQQPFTPEEPQELTLIRTPLSSVANKDSGSSPRPSSPSRPPPRKPRVRCRRLADPGPADGRACARPAAPERNGEFEKSYLTALHVLTEIRAARHHHQADSLREALARTLLVARARGRTITEARLVSNAVPNEEEVAAALARKIAWRDGGE
jgi:hypothetical protein